jgi:KDO2-lipid IV(A) lauroyltransferase
MDLKQFKKGASRFFGYLGLKGVIFLMKPLPWSWVFSFASGLGSLAFILAVRQRRIAMDSLSTAFKGSLPAKEVRALARECFRDMAKSGVELLYLMDNRELIKKQMGFRGKELLDRALAAGRGVILVSAHFGNFPLMLCRIALEGYNVSGIMRPMRDERIEKVFYSKRTRMGIKTIYSVPREACVNTTIKYLRDNEAVFLPLDQNFGTAGVFVDFFGEKAATATGPVVFAQRTGAALLPCFAVRQPDNTHLIVFEPPVTLEEGKDAQETILLNTQKLTGIIESYIRKYPAQWGWIHRRWKSKPA